MNEAEGATVPCLGVPTAQWLTRQERQRLGASDHEPEPAAPGPGAEPAVSLADRYFPAELLPGYERGSFSVDLTLKGGDPSSLMSGPNSFQGYRIM